MSIHKKCIVVEKDQISNLWPHVIKTIAIQSAYACVGITWAAKES